MKRTLFIPVLFAAMLVAGCQDEPAITSEPVDSTYTPPADDTIPAYTPISLAEYLPGTWVIDGTVVADLGYWDNYGYHDEWQFEYGYNYHGNDSLVFTDSTVYNSAYGGATGPYVILDSNRIQFQLPIYLEFYEVADTPWQNIYQLNENQMLIKGYFTNHNFNFRECEWYNLWYLFVRQQ